MSLPQSCDVLVIGSGNAGFSAAISAKQSGVHNVVLIDKCDEAWAGGNSYFTAGAYRTAHGGLQDLLPLVTNVDATLAEHIELDPYNEQDFADDLQRTCGGRSDPDLSRILITESNAAIKWLASIGVRFQLSFNRQAYKINNRYKFWGGLHLKTEEGGKGLIQDHLAAAARFGVGIYWSTALVGLVLDKATGRVIGARVRHQERETSIFARAVIVATGGFESNPRMRAKYLGPGWDMAKVRGTPHNTGDGLEICIRDALAQPYGNWSSCHSVAWDANTKSDAGDRLVSNEFTKSGYPLGLMLNLNGERFVDEGVDLRNYTYAKFGRAILAQPEHCAFQIWDARTTPWLRDEEYREERVERISALSIEELAEKCEQCGLGNKEAFIQTLKEYNTAVYARTIEQPSLKWNPSIRDGLSTQSSQTKLSLPKSNWALPLDKPPFLAVKVTCGITFTFGGLKVNPETAQAVCTSSGKDIPGLYVIGEMLGGLFYGNYPGGSGLTCGTVFGRRAAKAALQSIPAARRDVQANL